jgi:hypothetical protein
MLATLGQLQGGGLPTATYLLGQLLETMRLENVRARPPPSSPPSFLPY